MNLTPKQEAFCLAYMETGNASEAYGLAGYSTKATPKTINEASSRLLKNSNIIARLSTLRERAVERTLVTVESIAAELEEARTLAHSISQPAAAVSASMGKAKLYGLLTDKTELTGKDGAAIQLEQVKNDAESFTSTIVGLAARAGETS